MRLQSSPLVTCLCLTRNRRAWLPAAIRAFQLQTYQPRELLIVADSEQDGRDLVPVQNSWIRFVALPKQLLIGEKRNAGAEHAAGSSILLHWDDDDWSNPGRIEDQVARLVESGKAVTGYHSAKFTNGRNWWHYSGAPQYALGSSLCYWREWWRAHPFRAMQVSEDAVFATQATQVGQLVSVDAQDFLWASVHDGNTSQRRTSESSHNWKAIDAPATFGGCGWPAATAGIAAA